MDDVGQAVRCQRGALAYTTLAGALERELDCPVELTIVEDYSAEVLAMENDELDIAQFGPLGFVFASQRADAQPVASFADAGGELTTYKAGIWVPGDSPLQSIQQLRDRSLALAEPGSTSGDALPRLALAKAGLDPEQDVKLEYAGGHPEALLALTNGKVDAAEINTQQLKTSMEEGEFDPSQFPPDLGVRRRPQRPDHRPRQPRPRVQAACPAGADQPGSPGGRGGRRLPGRRGARPAGSGHPRDLRAAVRPRADPRAHRGGRLAMGVTVRTTSAAPAAGGGKQAPAGDAGPQLSIRGLTKAFGQRTVLRGVDLEVRRGECVTVLGANGSGKSTALRCVVGLAEPDEGYIRIGGRMVSGLRGAQLAAARREAAMVFQQIHLVRRRTALDNVCCGALGRLRGARSLTPLAFPGELRDEAMGCLDRVGLADRASDRVADLSGGQQQRVAVARALCQRASIILADEPVAALDPTAAEQVMELLRRLAHEEHLAVAVVLHQPALARRHSDRIVGLLGGRVTFNRAPAEVDDATVGALYTYTHEEPRVA
ncbi:MAG: phosphate/phosphite/phosphonate ABC transporter substrate-binding protein [Solirubrobacteraceae bacterium MAG38_C4-C5]|nr:phosphate/phosphite/phosphonate ABC transporter substrate-binding protein [Candidatus Siliceabacter maunaloa]